MRELTIESKTNKSYPKKSVGVWEWLADGQQSLILTAVFLEYNIVKNGHIEMTKNRAFIAFRSGECHVFINRNFSKSLPPNVEFTVFSTCFCPIF